MKRERDLIVVFRVRVRLYAVTKDVAADVEEILERMQKYGAARLTRATGKTRLRPELFFLFALPAREALDQDESLIEWLESQFGDACVLSVRSTSGELASAIAKRARR